MTYLLLWRQAKWLMAGPGWSRSRPVQMTSSRETGPQNIANHNRGGGKTDQHFPSCSRITRGSTHYQQLYHHAGEQPRARHNVATLGITHLHPELLPHEARSLSNQVLCMIAEYHLTGSAQGSSSLSPVLPEAARNLLPPIEDYVAGGAFQGMRDVKVIDRAKTL